MTAPSHQRPLQEALDECLRELLLRERCFPRWIEEGRLSRTDANDRLERLRSACIELEKLLALREAAPPVEVCPKPLPDYPLMSRTATAGAALAAMVAAVQTPPETNSAEETPF